MLWKFNRFLPEKPRQTGTLAKTLLLMLIDVGLPAICVILPPVPSVLQEDSSGAWVYTRGSVLGEYRWASYPANNGANHNAVTFE